MIKNYNSLSWRSETYLNNLKEKVVGKDPTQSTLFGKNLWLKSLLICFLFLTGSLSFAQTVTIGTGTATSSSLPIYSCYDYNYSQQIYTAAQIGQAGTINKIRFYYNNAGTSITQWDNWTVFVGQTTKTSFTSDTDWVPLASMSQVFSGTITPVAGNWFDINFTTPFVYNGTSNLVVAVDENSSGYSCTAAFRSFTSGTNTGIHYYADGNNPNPASPPSAEGRFNDLAQMQVVFASSVAPSCAIAQVPTNSATGVTRNPTLTWTEGTGGPTSYDVYFGTATNPPLIGNQAGTSYTPVAPINANTVYYWKIVPKNANGDATGCTVFSFTTGTEFNYCGSAYSNGCSNGATIASFSTSSALSNISNLSSGCTSTTALGYTNYSATLQMAASQSTSFGVSVAIAAYGGGVKIWIDYNQNGIFEATEIATQSATTIGSGSTYTGTISIPATATLGVTRMRVRVVENSTTFTPCDAQSYGETEDYAINIITPPSCLPPSTLATSALTTTGVTMSWTASATNPTSGYDIYYSTSPTSPTAATVPTVNNHAASPYLATGLTAATTYYWWVRSDCTSETSLWSSGGSFYTSHCVPTGSTSYYLTNVTTNGGVTNFNNTTAASVGGYGNFSTSISASNFIGQPTSITLTSSSTYDYFYCWIDWNNDLDFNDPNENIFATFTTTPNHTGTINIPTGTPLGNYRMRVANSASGSPSACGPAIFSEYEDYTFSVVTQPTCVAPTALVASAVSNSTATLSWTAALSTPSNGYDIYYSTSNTAPTASTTPTVNNHTASPYAVTGLTSATVYYWWVRSDCSTTDKSAWASGGNFKTSPNYCGGDRFYDSGGATGDYLNSTNETTVITPTAGNLAVVTFSSFNTESNYDFLKVYDGPSASSTALHTGNGFNGDLSAALPGPFTSTHPSGALTFVFTTDGSGVRSGWNAGVVCSPLPTCLAPTALVTSALTYTTATLNWTASVSNPSNGYDIYYSTSNTAPTAATTPTVNNHTASPYAVTGLTAETSYYWWVRSDCSTTDKSSWAIGGSFYTGYCLPIGSTSYYLANVSTSNGITNLANSTAAATGGYANYTATTSLSNYIGQATSITLTSLSSAYFHCWIDWNNDFDFADANETIFATTSYTANHTGTINIPAGTPNGNYRMRVANSASGSVTPCGPATYGEYEDYAFSVITAPTCLAPTAIATSALTTTTATLTWTASTTTPSNGYDIYYSTSNTSPTAATVPSVNNHPASPYTITGLTAEQTYYYWVRSDCSSELSAWAGPYSFLTGYCLVSTTSSGDYTSAFSTTNATSNVTYTASTNPVGSYSNQTSQTFASIPSQTINFTHSYVGGVNGLKIWIDWNNDLDFTDVGEQMFYLADGNATKTGSITIPATAAGGNYRMRVRSEYGSAANPVSCGNVYYGTTIDFTLSLPIPVTAPPTASAQTLCNGATVANLVATGTAIKWYTAATGGTALVSTTALATGIYYVSQTLNASESVRTSVAVTINTTTAPTASAQTFCVGSTVANLVATGTGIKWYTAATGGTELVSTTALASGTYYALQTLNSCESTRTSVTITVNTTTAPTASAQSFCDAATVANLVATGTSIKWYGAATGGTALVSTTALASGTYYVSQTLNTCESTRTSVTVAVNITTAPVASAQSFCTGATIANLVATGTAIKWYTAATGGTALVSTATLVGGTYFASQTLNSCESVRTSVAVTVNATASAPTASAQAFCTGATVADLVANGTILKWYTTATAGTALVSTTALTTGTFYVSQTLVTCESTRTSVSVTVNPIPLAPVASAQTFCLGSTVANLVATGTAQKWYTTATGGTALASTTALASGTYYVTQTSIACESARTSVVVTVNTVAIPTGAATQTFCGSSNLSQLVATGTAIKWYTVATGGTEYPTALLSSIGLVNGNSYYASQTVNGCESQTRLQVTVVINAIPSAPNTSAQAFCNSALVSNLLPNGSTFSWYNTATGGTALVSTATLATGNYYVSQTLNGCEGVRAAVLVTLNTTAAPTASAQTFCGSALVGNLVATGTAIKWYTAATGGTALLSSATLATGTYFASQTLNACEGNRTSVAVTVNTTGAPLSSSSQTFCTGASVANLAASGTAIKWYSTATGGTALVSTTSLSTGIYYVSQTINGCESSRASVVVIVNTTTAPTASAQTFCTGATVASLVATGTTIKWYTTATGGTALVNTTALASGTYYASQTLNTCESVRTSVTVTVNNTTAPTAAAQSFCTGATVANLVATGTAINWYAAATGGNALTATSTLSAGTYYASQTVNGCESGRTSVTVTVNTTAAPTALVTQSFCMGSSVDDLVATGTTIKWYTTATGGTALVNTTTLSSGVYYASQTLNTCESARTLVVVTVIPVVINTTTVDACDTYTWSENGTVYTVSGTYTVVTGCDSEILELTINTTPVATITRSGDDLNVNPTAGATYQWIKCDSLSTPIAGATDATYLAIETGSYAVEVTNNGCTVTSECFDVATLDVKSIDVANLNFYPNPVTNALTVTYTKVITGIQVYDMTGRLIKNINTNANEVSVDMSEMPTSIYIVKVIAENTSSEFRVFKD
jgi:hypothetical protein